MPVSAISTAADLIAWEASIPLTPTEPFVAELHASITLTSQFNEGPDHSDPYQFRNTTASNYIEIRPAPGLAWNDNPAAVLRPDASQGIAITGSLSSGSPALTRWSSPYTRLRNLQIINLGGGSGGVGACVYTWSFSDYFLLENCLLVANQPNQFGVVYLHNNQTCRNNLIVNVAAVAADTHGTNGVKINQGTTAVYNNTIARPAFLTPPSACYGICPAFSTANPKFANNAIFGFTQAIHNLNDDGGTPPFASLGTGSGHNATDSATMSDNVPGVGSGNLPDLIYGSQFANVGPTSGYLSAMDFSLPATSALIDAGSDLSPAGVTADARLALRPRGNGHDVGAWEYPSPIRHRIRGLRAGGRAFRLYS